MKHTLKITFILIFLFLIAQIFGLFLINSSIEISKTNETKVELTHKDTLVGERPDFTPLETFIFLSVAVLIGTLIALIIIKLKLKLVWNLWFFMAVFLATSISLNVLFKPTIAFIIAFIVTLLKFKKPNLITHNLSEMFIYPGIAIILIPISNLFWTSITLLFFSLYDMYAVWMSKHMIKLAEFQTENNKFAGLIINYKRNKKIKKNKPRTIKNEHKTAILGGGDIFLPLLFEGVFMEFLIKNLYLSKFVSFYFTLIVVLFSTLALTFLFYISKKNKFYPAMPFITFGCFTGAIISYLIIHCL